MPDKVQTIWTERGDPSSSVWNRTENKFLGFHTRTDGFEEIVTSDTVGYSFSERDDGFLSLDALSTSLSAFQLSITPFDFLEVLNL